MKTPRVEPPLPFVEFVVLMAILTSLAALTIDAILPALPEIGASLNVVDPNDTHFAISILMLGMGFGQLIFGELADAWGRKPAMYIGLGTYMIGSLICLSAGNLIWMLVGRLIQGVGASSTRVISMALIRDQFIGRNMARVMSFIMMVFIIVPMVAPTFGQWILHFFEWQIIFLACLAIALIGGIWFALRQPETLDVSRIRPFRAKNVFGALTLFWQIPSVRFYTLASGLIFGAFLTYLSISQSLFERTFHIVDDFPKYFAALAAAFGVAAFANTRLVMRFGMLKMIMYALLGFTSVSLALFLVAMYFQGIPPFSVFLLLAFPLFFCKGLLLANLNALAMQPLGEKAGQGAAAIGFSSMIVSVCCAVVVGALYQVSLIPIYFAYIVIGLAALIFVGLGYKANPEIEN